METLNGSDPPLHREAWHQLKGLYQAVVDRDPPPARVTLEWIAAERVDLYSYVPTLGGDIPISVEPLPVDDSVPTEDKIEWAVKILQHHRSKGTSRMRAEHLEGWLAAARKKDKEAVSTEQENPTEGRAMPVPDRTGKEKGEGTEESREKTHAEAYNWDRVVDIIHTEFR